MTHGTTRPSNQRPGGVEQPPHGYQIPPKKSNVAPVLLPLETSSGESIPPTKPQVPGFLARSACVKGAGSTVLPRWSRTLGGPKQKEEEEEDEEEEEELRSRRRGNNQKYPKIRAIFLSDRAPNGPNLVGSHLAFTFERVSSGV